jgi:hypothetical protein
LSEAKDLLVPMPGISDSNGIVTIQKFEADIYVLPTKTKPMKIQIRGSDGKNYTYLLKGLEDLHLDERIQHFLKTVNNLLLANTPKHKKAICARSYTVTPFGDKFGMIQWVSNATQLFALYKRWQQWDHAAKCLSFPPRNPSDPSSAHPQLPIIQRPREIYNKKIQTALQNAGIGTSTPRARWPLKIHTEAFQELVAETPRDLIAQELLFTSPCSGTWWDRVEMFCRSNAVNSVIGYIIGLGDRHLDNILLDSATGEVVHIDYNVCFEKGLRLLVRKKYFGFSLLLFLLLCLGSRGSSVPTNSKYDLCYGNTWS